MKLKCFVGSDVSTLINFKPCALRITDRKRFVDLRCTNLADAFAHRFFTNRAMGKCGTIRWASELKATTANLARSLGEFILINGHGLILHSSQGTKLIT